MSIIITVITLLLNSQPISGNASQYDPGIMRRVIANRQAGITEHGLPETLPAVHGYVAVLDCDEIGKLWLVKPERGDWELMLVADCSGHESTSNWMRENNILLEVDYGTAVRWNTVGSGVKVEVIGQGF